MKKIGLFGGAFNPIHIGHLIAARCALEQLGLETIIFIPTGDPPGKSAELLIPGDHRLKMTALATAHDRDFEVSDIEVRRPGKSYTVDTVRAFRNAHPDAELTFLLGSDCIHRLFAWKGIEELRQMTRFAVLMRSGHRDDDSEPDIARVACPAIDLSSTIVRQRVSEGRSIAHMTPPAVADYIAEEALYEGRKPSARILDVLKTTAPRVIACSGGIDSMLLATLAHRAAPHDTIVAHAVSPAVPAEATRRVKDWAAGEGWRLHLVTSGEFADEAYLSNPVNRCYFCKSNLYDALKDIVATLPDGATVFSGANTDDLGEYRPGLEAAAENGVRHPFIEAGIAKSDIRAIAADLGLPFAHIPASPCLASRLYTGTRVTAPRLAAVDASETFLRARTGVDVLRCRILEERMIVEVTAKDRDAITKSLLDETLALARTSLPELTAIALDEAAYRPGRAFVGAPTGAGA